MPISKLRQWVRPVISPRAIEPDRNHARGGRSFYFFDFDDNIAFLASTMYVFHKITGEARGLSSGEFVLHAPHIGKSGPYADYVIDFDEQGGSFRNFRDQDHTFVEKWVLGRKQTFIEDLAHALGFPEFHWQGPAWSGLYHAVANGRPMSVITARGHAPSTIIKGLELFVREGHLPAKPNLMAVYPVNHPEIRRSLGDHDFCRSVPELKRRAIRASVQQAIEQYGRRPHQFGMSDDDPLNIEMIAEEMRMLKKEYPEMSFFVIETHGGLSRKHEILYSP